jgi:hypothetical protein
MRRMTTGCWFEEETVVDMGGFRELKGFERPGR